MSSASPSGAWWWPVHVDAEIEPDGLRVTGSQAAGVLEPGSLLPWEAITSPELPRCRDEFGKLRKLGRRPIVLRTSKRGRPNDINRPAVAWFSNRGRQFRISIPPGSQRRGTVQVFSTLMLVLLPTSLPLFIAGGIVPIGVDAGEVGRRADIAMNCFLLLCAVGVAVGLFVSARELLAIHRGWWIEDLNDIGVRMRRRNVIEDVAWGQLREFRHRFTKLEIRTEDGRRIHLEPARPAVWAVRARVRESVPLWTVLFVATIIAALASPWVMVWVWRWLQLPPAFGWSQALFMQGFMLIFPGLLALHWWMARRGMDGETRHIYPE